MGFVFEHRSYRVNFSERLFEFDAMKAVNSLNIPYVALISWPSLFASARAF